MEFLLFLLYPAGIVSIVGVVFLYLRSTHTAQRALTIAKAHMTPAEDIAKGYAAVEASVKALRAAKKEEQALYETEWEKQFYTPEEYKELLDKRHHEKMLSDHKIKSRFISADKIKTVSAVQEDLVPDGPEWVPLPGARHKEPEELTYSQRRIQRAGAFVRKAASTSAPVYGVAEGGSVVRFDGYVHGETVAGNDVWFVYIGKNSNLPKYIHSVATTNRSTSGLKDLTEYDTVTMKSFDGTEIRTSKIPNGGITIGSNYIQMPNATIRSRQAENLNPDQVRELERQPAIVKNYQEDRRNGKYDPVPKEFIPSAVKRVKSK